MRGKCFSFQRRELLFVLDVPCPSPGSDWRRVSGFANSFLEEGWKCRVLSTFSPSRGHIGSMKVLKMGKLTVYNVVPSIRINNSLLLLNNLIAFLPCLAILLLVKPDAVIVSIPSANQLLALFILCKLLGIKLVIDYRDEFEEYQLSYKIGWMFWNRLLRNFLLAIYRHSDLTITVTSAVAEGLKLRGIRNVRVVHDGVDTHTFRPMCRSEARRILRIQEDCFVIIYLGYVYYAYRLDTVLEALILLARKTKENKYLLLILGGGDVQRIRRYSHSLGVENAVRYIGPIKDATSVARILSAADVGIIPYDDNPLLKKTLSAKLFEYCACGLPVIATVPDGSILEKYIRKYSLGIAVPSLNSQALSRAIEHIESRLRAGDALRLNVVSFARTYDKKKIAKRLLSYIQGLK